MKEHRSRIRMNREVGKKSQYMCVCVNMKLDKDVHA